MYTEEDFRLKIESLSNSREIQVMFIEEHLSALMIHYQTPENIYQEILDNFFAKSLELEAQERENSELIDIKYEHLKDRIISNSTEETNALNDLREQIIFDLELERIRTLEDLSSYRNLLLERYLGVFPQNEESYVSREEVTQTCLDEQENLSTADYEDLIHSNHSSRNSVSSELTYSSSDFIGSAMHQHS